MKDIASFFARASLEIAAEGEYFTWEISCSTPGIGFGQGTPEAEHHGAGPAE